MWKSRDEDESYFQNIKNTFDISAPFLTRASGWFKSVWTTILDVLFGLLAIG